MAASVNVNFAPWVPKMKKENFCFVDVVNKKIGKARADFFYDKNADTVFATVPGKSAFKKTMGVLKPEQVIADFMLFDYTLAVYRDKEKFIDILNFIKSFGVNRVVAIDFSLYLDTPEPVMAHNLYINLRRMVDAHEHGFQTVLNWNMVHRKFMGIYLHAFPHEIPTLFIDRNHTFNNAEMRVETALLTEFLQFFKVKSAVFQTSKATLSDNHDFIAELVRRGIPYKIIPSQTALVPLSGGFYAQERARDKKKKKAAGEKK